jgi:hypothetical protein
MINKILIPFVYGVKSANNAETRSRLGRLIDYISRHRFDGDYLVLLSAGITRPSLARQLFAMIRQMGCKLPEDRFIFEEKSWDTTTQIKFMAPMIRKINSQAEILVFSNALHSARIKIIFARFDLKVKLKPSRLGYESIIYKLMYILFYEPLMLIATLLGADNFISSLTNFRQKNNCPN